MRAAALLVGAGVAVGAPRDYYVCNMTCAGGETWSTCRSERCTPTLPEDKCNDGSEPEATSERVAGPHACGERSLEPGSFAERCTICTSTARAVLVAARQGVQGGAAALCAAAVETTAAVELPTFRTCRMDPDGCSAFLSRLSTSTCEQIAALMVEGAGRAAILREAQRFCGEELRLRRNTTVSEATLCEAPRDMGLRVMAISASIAAVVFSTQVAPAWLTTF
eukprot:scaffold15271_cov110-Isochrysis_galbana.AAC.2